MKKTALVIMAAGIGSRFGGGIKQLEPVGPGGEIIMDYSIHDALEAGFDRIVFVIRHDLEKDFREVIGDRIEKIAPVSYAFQELDDIPSGFTVPQDRKKPWGTGQAVLSVRDIVNEPFLVINADDYYGKEVFQKIHDYMNQVMSDKKVDMVFVMLTDILNESTELLCCGKDAVELATGAYHLPADDYSLMLPGVVSRKKQLIPSLITAMQQEDQ